MPIVTPDTLKGYFNNAAVPNYDNYVDLIDSLYANPGSIISSYLGLEGLRGFWVPSSVSTTSSLIDLSNNHNLLTKSGIGPSIRYIDSIAKFIPFTWLYNGQYFYLADNAALSITGTETYIYSSDRGLTIGCWIYIPSTPPSSDNGIIGKFASDQYSYLLYRATSTNRFRFGISNNGTNVVTVESTRAYSEDRWNFIVGRFKPNSELAIFYDGIWTRNTIFIPASIFDSTARFEIGSFNAGLSSTTWTHYGALYFITSSALIDSQIENLYAMSKPLFIF